MTINGREIPAKLVSWVVGIIFAAGGLVVTVKECERRLDRLEGKVDWLVQRELAAGPPEPVGWGAERPVPEPIDPEGLLSLP